MSVGDTIVVFDAAHPAENGGETRTVQASDPGADSTTILTLDDPLTNSYLASIVVGGVPTFEPDLPDNKGHSGGVGVIHSADNLIYDTSPNQINGTGSAFYDADMRDIEQPYDDAFVEFLGLRGGMTAVPLLPQAWFNAVGIPERARFSQVWFSHYQDGGPAPIPPLPAGSPNVDLSQNYFHLMGVSSKTGAHGMSQADYDYSYIFLDSITVACSPCTAGELQNHIRETTVHEFAHQFRINGCNSQLHDSNNAWCGGPGGSCDNPTYGYHYCLMHVPDANSLDMRKDGIMRLDCDDLAADGPDCGAPACANGVSVRTDTDPE